MGSRLQVHVGTRHEGEDESFSTGEDKGTRTGEDESFSTGRNRETGLHALTVLSALDPLVQGFSDAFYKEQTAFYLDETAVRASEQSKAYYVDAASAGHPDFWLEPCQVWEIRGADLTLSPTHPAGRDLLGNGRGVSLRFPRFVRTRPDKTVEQATSVAELVRMYRKQTSSGPRLGEFQHDGNDDDNDT